MAYEPVIPSLIENTTMTKYINASGVFRAYNITPNEGYVLHDNAGNWTDFETGIEYEAYFTGTCSCAPTYDFEANPREFYAVPASEVPADQIFGGVNNDHEVM